MTLRILEVAPQYPFPPDDGGRISIYASSKELVRMGHHVDFLCLSTSIPADGGKNYPATSVTVIQENTPVNPWKLALSLVQKESLYLSKHRSSRALAAALQIIDSNDIQIVHADHTAMAPLALEIKQLRPKVKVGLRLHNVEHRIWERYAEQDGPWYRKAYVKWQAAKLRREEADLFPRFDVCFPISPTDLEVAQSIAPHGNYVLSTAGIDDSYWTIGEKSFDENPTIMIATTYKWVHNVDGVMWFIRSVLPILRVKHPTLRLQLIGKDAPEVLKSFTAFGVDYIGYVDDVRPYMRAADCLISPLFVGAGMRIKILEAMACGLPVVSTRVGAEGISARTEHGLFVADSPQEQASIISRLVSNRTYSQQIGHQGCLYVKAHYTWAKSLALMTDAYTRILGLNR